MKKSNRWQKNWMYKTERSRVGWWAFSMSRKLCPTRSSTYELRFRKRLMMLCANKHQHAKMRLDRLKHIGDGPIAYKTPTLISPKLEEFK